MDVVAPNVCISVSRAVSCHNQEWHQECGIPDSAVPSNSILYPSSKTGHRCSIVYTGYVHHAESHTSKLCWYTSVFVDSRQPTWLTTHSRSLNFRADNAYIHRRPRHWLYHRPVSEPLAIELFPSQRQKRGTVCRQK